MTSYHLSQSVRGALVNWSEENWRDARSWIRRGDGTPFPSAASLKVAFLDHLTKGHEFLPMGDCDNFDFKTGCRGHPDKQTL